MSEAYESFSFDEDIDRRLVTALKVHPRVLGLPADDLTAFLRGKARWAVTRGQAFGIEGAGFARLNIACTRAKLEAGLDRLSSALATTS